MSKTAVRTAVRTDAPAPAPGMTYDALYAEQFASSVSYVIGLAHCPRAEAEDIAQAAFVALWEHWPLLASISVAQQHAYLYRVVRNRAIDYGRRAQMIARHYNGALLSLSRALDDPTLASASIADYDVLDSDSATDPEQVACVRETWDALARGAARSAPDGAAVLSLLAAGYGAGDIAARLGCSRSATKMRVMRTRRGAAAALARRNGGDEQQMWEVA